MATERKRKSASESLEKKFGKLTFRRLLRATREADELSQEAFAGRLGISKQHLSDIERGRKTVSPERAYEWARRLGYVEMQWAQLALQDMLDKTSLKVRVTLHRAA